MVDLTKHAAYYVWYILDVKHIIPAGKTKGLLACSENSRNDWVHAILTMAIGDDTLSVETWLSLFLSCRVVEGWASHVLNSISQFLIVNHECGWSIFTFLRVVPSRTWFQWPSSTATSRVVTGRRWSSQWFSGWSSQVLCGDIQRWRSHGGAVVCSTARIGSLLMLNWWQSHDCKLHSLCSMPGSLFICFLQFDSKNLQCQDSPQCEPCRI